MEVVEGVAGEEDHHDDQEEQGEEPAEAEGQHDEHDEDGKDTCNSILHPYVAVHKLPSPELFRSYFTTCRSRKRHGARSAGCRRDGE